ncbi:DUF308 domain-containing protein [Methylobacterium brachythecii]|uniref:Membrane protein n=1 Tax=Methylobacterium brachythecii TaxID=1176177 RepID=A0A7W6API7_9HYPH|nr:DUF308 domain-containing protein [Methylobacterium brachythecii]MBB3904905.1 uncharacterized membrane protein HdeD (DUF308 family) [Methylobacterium brachythecii]GLS46897.1 membrane protein [Methylobacterium brachythecii]
MNTVASPNWLRSYYFTRAGIAAAWVLAGFTVGKSGPAIASVLLIAYPAWDAFANLIDARRSGGLRANPSQTVNAIVSVITAIAVAIALGRSPNAVLAVFGAWATLSGLSQLATGSRRWGAGAQWAMVLSGAQSALAGAFFIKRAAGPDMPGITDVAPYAAFGAFYFLVSAVWLTVAEMRKHSAQPVA